MDFQIEDIEDSKPNLSTLDTKPNDLNYQTNPEVCDNSWKAPIEASTSQNHSIEIKIIKPEENIDKVDQIEVPFKVEELKIDNNIFLEQMSSSVHEEKQYNCKLCDKSFNKPEHLSEHVITIHVSCDICDKIKIFPHEICHFTVP